MNTTNPGIFIPLIHSLSELVYIDSQAEYQKLFAVAPDSLIFIRGFQSFSAVRTRSNMSKPCLQSKKL